MIDDDPEMVSREEAKRLIDEATFGALTVCTVDPIPTIGTVDPESVDVDATVTSYRFGTSDDDADDDAE